MHVHTRFVAALALFAALLGSVGHTAAGGQRPVLKATIAPIAPKTPVIVVSGSPQRVLMMSGERSSPPAALSPIEKAEIFKAALGLQNILPAGIGNGIRLTPSQPYLPGKGHLDFSGVKVMIADDSGGRTEMLKISENPVDTDGRRGVASVGCNFRPAVTNQALLVDVSIWMAVTPPNRGRVQLSIPGGTLDQVMDLLEGAHHLTVIFKPSDLAEKGLLLSDMHYSYGLHRITFFACEITPLLNP